jgi:orotate phosphoribosyltransferase
MYYQTLLGLPYDSDLDMHALLACLEVSSQFLISSHPEPSHIKIQELDHPMIITLAVHEAMINHSDIDTVVTLPSGGTQLGILLQMGLELERREQGRSEGVPLLLIPLSIHSGKKNYGSALTPQEIAARVPTDDVLGKTLLLIEDNSNTGESIRIVQEGLSQAGAQDVRAVLAEVDPTRAILKHSGPTPPKTVTNFMHRHLQGSTGIVPIGSIDGVDMQWRKVLAQRIANERLKGRL